MKPAQPPFRLPSVVVPTLPIVQRPAEYEDAAADQLEAQAAAKNTRRAYETDWKHFCFWCEKRRFSPLPYNPLTIRAYITAQVNGGAHIRKCAMSTIERRLAGLAWYYRQFGYTLDRKDPDISLILAGARRSHGQPADEKEAVLTAEIVDMIKTIDATTLKGMRDRAILLIGFAGGLRRSEIVGLDCGPHQTAEGQGWPTFRKDGILIRVTGKNQRWREVIITPGSEPETCPVTALKNYMSFARIDHGPIFRRFTRHGITTDRLSPDHVAILVKDAAEAAKIQPELGSEERRKLYAGHSLRAGFATEAKIDTRLVQEQLGHADAKMTRRYQRRRDQFRGKYSKALDL